MMKRKKSEGFTEAGNSSNSIISSPQKKVRKSDLDNVGAATSICDSHSNVSEVNVVQLAKSRSHEIAALAEATKQKTSNTRLMQTLPRHMRRRAMSHNPKRVPRRLRDCAERELIKMNAKPKNKKCPSRRHRRRPGNLLSEYNRRKRKNIWLETHIWHAKRFHMKERWGYKIADYPNEKSIRAAYRATVNHSLLLDLSYYCCIEINGNEELLLNRLSTMTSTECGPTFASKMFIDGRKEGKVVIYKSGQYPYGAIGPVAFLWKPSLKAIDDSDSRDNDFIRTLWIWTHPSTYQNLINEFELVFELSKDICTSGAERIETNREINNPTDVLVVSDYVNHKSGVKLVQLKDQLTRFRLIGPASNSILFDMMKPIVVDQYKDCSDDDESIMWWLKISQQNDWKRNFTAQKDNWTMLCGCPSPAMLSPGSVYGLVVQDPRISMPPKRTKSVCDSETWNAASALNDSLEMCASPIWSAKIRHEVKSSKIPDGEMNKLRSSHVIAGSNIELKEKECKIPILLIQQQGADRDVTGYSSGWDIIVPSGWAMAFWLSMVYRGARVGGLREFQSVAQESLDISFPSDFPDTSSSIEEYYSRKEQLIDKYIRYPPDKRPNYTKLKVAAPFHFPWPQLVCNWMADSESCPSSKTEVSASFYVLRDRRELRKLQMFVTTLATQTEACHSSAIVPVIIRMVQRGIPNRFCIICIPSNDDLKALESDSKYDGPRETLAIKSKKQKKMTKDDLIDVDDVKNYSSRETIGYVTSGRFTYTMGKGHGLGFVSCVGLKELCDHQLSRKRRLVVVRNTNSVQYRFAYLDVLT